MSVRWWRQVLVTVVAAGGLLVAGASTPAGASALRSSGAALVTVAAPRPSVRGPATSYPVKLSIEWVGDHGTATVTPSESKCVDGHLFQGSLPATGHQTLAPALTASGDCKREETQALFEVKTPRGKYGEYVQVDIRELKEKQYVAVCYPVRARVELPCARVANISPTEPAIRLG